MTTDHNPIICAIDTPDLTVAKTLVSQVAPHVGAVKLGLEFFVRCGVQGVADIEAMGVPVFLDLKFHDIPNTVAKAIASTAPISPFLMTVHAGGGRTMMEHAARAATELGKPARPMVVGVTALTSMDADDLQDVGVERTISDHVVALARLARESGLDGVVCSSHEIAMLREALPRDTVLVVPGIRPANAALDDQKRVMAPKQAMDAGADYLVIGRPITQADSPADAARTIAASLKT